MSLFDSSKFTRIEHDKKGAILKYDDKDAFVNGTSIPLKTLKEVEDYRKEYAKEATLCATELAESTFTKEKDLKKVTVEFPFSTSQIGHIAVEVDRTAKVNLPGQKDKLAKVQIKAVVKDPYNKVSKDKVIHVCEKKLHKFIMD